MLAQCAVMLLSTLRFGVLCVSALSHDAEHVATGDDCDVPAAMPSVHHNDTILVHLRQDLFSTTVTYHSPALAWSRVLSQHYQIPRTGPRWPPLHATSLRVQMPRNNNAQSIMSLGDCQRKRVALFAKRFNQARCGSIRAPAVNE